MRGRASGKIFFALQLMLADGRGPGRWKSAVIVPFYKGKGSTYDCIYYRAISLVSLASKVYAKVLTRRIQGKSEKYLWEAQGGFRPGRGCMDQVFSLRMVTEKFLALHRKIFCAFVDLEKTFDKVEVLPSYKVSGHLLQAVKSLYNDNRACVRVESDVSPWFDICIGVKQGCVMTPLLSYIWTVN